MIHAFTSAAPNYAGKALALFASLREHCPELVTHWLVVDRRSEAVSSQVPRELVDHVMFVDDIDKGKDPSWVFRHSVVELSTAIKPYAASEIIDREDCDALLYFDPDIVVFSPLEDLLHNLVQASVILTPHLLKPQRDDEAILDHELCALRHGVFNLGFLGIRDVPEGRSFLAWWKERCTAFCWGDWREGVFTDQKWVNFAPIFFPDTRILYSPRFNVAPWNINDRPLSGALDQQLMVGPEPLGFFHFSGFDSGAHDLMIRKYSGTNPLPMQLSDWYRRKTHDLGRSVPSAWRLGTYDDGSFIESRHRELYRKRVDLQLAFPNPYNVDPTVANLREWMRVTAPHEHPEMFKDTPEFRGPAPTASGAQVVDGGSE